MPYNTDTENTSVLHGRARHASRAQLFWRELKGKHKMKTKLHLKIIFSATLLLVSAATVVARESQTVNDQLSAQAAEIEALKQDVSSLKEANGARPSSGYDHGFFIGSKDGNYSLKFKMFSQFYYEFIKNEDAPDTNSFGIRRARFIFSGNVFNPNLTYMIMQEMTTSYSSTVQSYSVLDSSGNPTTVTDSTDKNLRLLYLWAQYRFADEFQVRIGEFIPPTEYFFLASGLLEFEDFPIIANTEPFTPNFQTGIDLLGVLLNKKMEYEIFAVNGSNFDRVNINKSFRVGACLTFNFMGDPPLGVADVDYSETPQFAWTVAGAYEKPDYNLAAPVNFNTGDNVYRGQTNLVFRYKGFAIVPEFIVVYDQKKRLADFAAAGQVGYFIIPKHFEIDAQTNFLRYEGPRNDRWEISGGFNYYFYGQPVKLQADYSLLINQRTGDNQNNHRVRIGAQVGFF